MPPHPAAPLTASGLPEATEHRVLRTVCLNKQRPLLIATGEAIPLRGLEGVPGLPGAPQDPNEG